MMKNIHCPLWRLNTESRNESIICRKNVRQKISSKFLSGLGKWVRHWEWSESESPSIMSDSLQPRGLYSPWNSLSKNTGVGSLSLLQGIFPPRDRTQVSHIAGGFFTSWATREAQVGQTMACSEWQWQNHRSVKSAMDFWHQNIRNVFRFDYPCVDSAFCVWQYQQRLFGRRTSILPHRDFKRIML